MVKDLLVLTIGCRDLGVMFYIQRGSLPTALTSPSHGASACTHTLIPVTACYRPINSTVSNESYVLISSWNKQLQRQKGLLCWQWDLTELLLLSPSLQPFSSTTQPHQGRRIKCLALFSIFPRLGGLLTHLLIIHSLAEIHFYPGDSDGGNRRDRTEVAFVQRRKDNSLCK